MTHLSCRVPCVQAKPRQAAHMINGQGRWRLHAQDPPEMVYKYCQSKLREKLETSNF